MSRFKQVQTSDISLRCPSCASENTQKVTSIVQSGTWVSKGTGVSVGRLFGRRSSSTIIAGNLTTTTGATLLVQALAAPAQPKPSTTWLVLLSMFVIFFAFVASLPLALIALGTCSWIIYKSIERYNREVSKWQSQIQNWDMLFYCSRCDSVYVPGTNTLCASSNMISIL